MYQKNFFQLLLLLLLLLKLLLLLMEQMERLGDFSNTQPHATYVALTHGLSNSWTFLSQLMNLDVDQLQPLENCIRHQIIPSLTEEVHQGI